MNARACSAYEDKIYINHDGKIYPCPSLKMREFQVDNILDTNFTVDRLLIEMNNMKTKFLNLNTFLRIVNVKHVVIKCFVGHVQQIL